MLLDSGFRTQCAQSPCLKGPTPNSSEARDMKFTPLKIDGAYLIDLEKKGDERGFFARQFCAEELKQHGLTFQLVQANISFTGPKHTLRGMHYQRPPKAETKIIRALRGAIWDCLLDVRAESPTFGQWDGAELSAENRRTMFAPKGVAHGFITLSEDTELLYLMDEFYAPEHARGVRWDDPRFAIEWPAEPELLNDRDRNYPDYSN